VESGMESNKMIVQEIEGKNSKEVLNRFALLFRKHDIFNQSFKIEYRSRKYKIYCGEDKFFVYRINPNPGIPPGIPGWIACMVTQDKIIDSGSMGRGDSGDPSIQGWLDCIANGNFKSIAEIE